MKKNLSNILSIITIALFIVVITIAGITVSQNNNQISTINESSENLTAEVDTVQSNIEDLWIHTDELDENQNENINSVQNDLWDIYYELDNTLNNLEISSDDYTYDEIRNELDNLYFTLSENQMFTDERIYYLENELAIMRNDIYNAWHEISMLQNLNNSEFILRDIHQENSIEDIYIDFMGMDITPQNYDDLVNMTSYNNDIWFNFNIDMFNQVIYLDIYRVDEFGNQLSNELENSIVSVSMAFTVDNGSIVDEIEVMFEDLFVIFLDSYIRFDLDDNEIITYAHSTLDYNALAVEVNNLYMNMQPTTLYNYNFIQFELDYYFNGQRVFGYYDININVNIN
jgi:uncharacterized protein YoxC